MYVCTVAHIYLSFFFLLVLGFFANISLDDLNLAALFLPLRTGAIGSEFNKSAGVAFARFKLRGMVGVNGWRDTAASLSIVRWVCCSIIALKCAVIIGSCS